LRSLIHNKLAYILFLLNALSKITQFIEQNIYQFIFQKSIGAKKNVIARHD